MKHLPLIILSLSIIPFTAHAQSDVEITKVKDNLHMLVSPMGGNVFVSTGQDGTFLVDDQLATRSEIIDNAIKTLSDKAAQFILNTHYHFDHSGGNEHFGSQDAVIVAHDNVRERLSTRQFITYFKREMQPLSKAGLPTVTFADGVTFHYNDNEIKIIHVPNAHTDGDAIAHIVNQNVIVTGDTVFNSRYPFIDTEHGGSLKGFLAAHDTILSLADDETIIVPGHGDLMNKADLQTYRDALNTIGERVQAAIKDGKTLEETIAAKLTQEFDEKMSKGHIVSPDAFVTILYEHLK